MSWTNLNWKEKRPRGIAFYCNCCDAHNYYDGIFMEGKTVFGQLECILCLKCYDYIGENCEHCHPLSENE